MLRKGDILGDACTSAYDVAALALQSLRHTGYAVRRHKLLFKQLFEVGNRSLLVVTFFGLFIGLILVLYGGDQLQRFSQEKFIGLTGLAIVWEFGPVFTAFILAGRIGSAYAAEIGTMQVYDEIDALNHTPNARPGSRHRRRATRPDCQRARRLLLCRQPLPHVNRRLARAPRVRDDEDTAQVEL